MLLEYKKIIRWFKNGKKWIKWITGNSEIAISFLQMRSYNDEIYGFFITYNVLIRTKFSKADNSQRILKEYSF